MNALYHISLKLVTARLGKLSRKWKSEREREREREILHMYRIWDIPHNLNHFLTHQIYEFRSSLSSLSSFDWVGYWCSYWLWNNDFFFFFFFKSSEYNCVHSLKVYACEKLYSSFKRLHIFLMNVTFPFHGPAPRAHLQALNITSSPDCLIPFWLFRVPIDRSSLFHSISRKEP